MAGFQPPLQNLHQENAQKVPERDILENMGQTPLTLVNT